MMEKWLLRVNANPFSRRAVWYLMGVAAFTPFYLLLERFGHFAAAAWLPVGLFATIWLEKRVKPNWFFMMLGVIVGAWMYFG